jgi:hypothetical protein|tara:strand:- start:179 stop:301 length:123 start_codon:yes stop_codon:yes gene_type:complete
MIRNLGDQRVVTDTILVYEKSRFGAMALNDDEKNELWGKV